MIICRKTIDSPFASETICLQLKESTFNKAMLLTFVRFNNDEGPIEEMLSARSLVIDVKYEKQFLMRL